MLEKLSLTLMLLSHRMCFCRLRHVMTLVLLRLAFSAKVIAAGHAPERFFDLALRLVSSTHVHSVSLVGLWTEYPDQGGFKQARHR